MSKVRAHRAAGQATADRRQYTREFKEEAVRMVLDGHSVSPVCQRLGLMSPNLLYNWKRKLVEQERDILEKALAIFGLNRLSHAPDLVRRQVVHDHDVARPERRRQLLPHARQERERRQQSLVDRTLAGRLAASRREVLIDPPCGRRPGPPALDRSHA